MIVKEIKSNVSARVLRQDKIIIYNSLDSQFDHDSRRDCSRHKTPLRAPVLEGCWFLKDALSCVKQKILGALSVSNSCQIIPEYSLPRVITLTRFPEDILDTSFSNIEQMLETIMVLFAHTHKSFTKQKNCVRSNYC